jgi:hypothetical protein
LHSNSSISIVIFPNFHILPLFTLHIHRPSCPSPLTPLQFPLAFHSKRKKEKKTLSIGFLSLSVFRASIGSARSTNRSRLRSASGWRALILKISRLRLVQKERELMGFVRSVLVCFLLLFSSFSILVHE